MALKSVASRKDHGVVELDTFLFKAPLSAGIVDHDAGRDAGCRGMSAGIMASAARICALREAERAMSRCVQGCSAQDKQALERRWSTGAAHLEPLQQLQE